MAWNNGYFGGYNPANTYIPQMAPQMPVQAPQSNFNAQPTNTPPSTFAAFL